jgi:hypothetical protein
VKGVTLQGPITARSLCVALSSATKGYGATPSHRHLCGVRSRHHFNCSHHLPHNSPGNRRAAQHGENKSSQLSRTNDLYSRRCFPWHVVCLYEEVCHGRLDRGLWIYQRSQATHFHEGCLDGHATFSGIHRAGFSVPHKVTLRDDRERGSQCL